MDKKLNVCMLVTAFPRFPGDHYLNFTLELSKHLNKQSVQIKVIAPGDRITKDTEDLEGIQIRRFAYMFPKNLQMIAYRDGMIRNLKKSWLAKIQLPSFVLFFFIKALRESRNFNIIHAHTSLPGLIGAWIKILTGKKLIITLHGTEIDMLKKGLIQSLTIFALKKADKIIAVSQALKKKTIDLGIDERKIEVIPDGVDINSFRYQEHNKEIDIVFVGRLSKEKGLSTLLEAVQNVLARLPELKVSIVGDGMERENLERLAKKLNLENHVSFLGTTPYDEIPAIMRKSKILVLPSLREGFGMVLVEAMSSGAAVIGSHVGGIPDIIRDNQNGLLFEKEKASELSDKIYYLLIKHKNRMKLIQKARETVEERFTWEKVAEKTLNIYQRINNEQQ